MKAKRAVMNFTWEVLAESGAVIGTVQAESRRSAGAKMRRMFYTGKSVRLAAEDDEKPPAKKPKLPKPVKRSELSTIKMTTGGEKRISKVILDGNVRQWVGIGWVDEGPATEADKLKYPRVLD